MKQVLYILRVVLGVLIGAYVTLLVGVNLDVCQRWLASSASAALTEYVNAPVKIDRVSIGLFNRVTLYDVELIDSAQQRVLQSDYVEGKVELLPLLLEGKVRLNTIALLNSDIEIKRNAEGQFNIQYLIDAISSKDNKEESKIDVAADVIIVRRSMVKYADALNPQLTTSLENLDLNLSLYNLSNDSLALRVRRCGFTMDNGEQLCNLKAQIDMSRSRLSVRHMSLQTSNAKLVVPQLQATYSIPNDAEWVDCVSSLQIKPFTVDARVNSLSIHCKAKMEDSTIGIEQLKVSEDENLVDLDIVGHLALATNTDDSGHKQLNIAGGDIRMNNIKADAAALEKVYSRLDEASPLLKKFWQAPQLNEDIVSVIKNVETISASGKLVLKSADNGIADISLESPVGNVNLAAILMPHSVKAKVDVKALNPAKIMAEDKLPKSVSLTLDGSMSLDAQNAQADVKVTELEWRDKTYTDIVLSGKMQRDDIVAQLQIDCPNAKANVAAKVNKKLSEMAIVADLDEWHLFLPEKISAVAGTLQADLHNLDTRMPTGQIVLEDLEISMQKNDSTSHLQLDQLKITSQKSVNGVKVDFTSDFASGYLSGLMDLPALKSAAFDIAYRTFPSLVGSEGKPQNPKNEKSGEAGLKQWNMVLNVKDTHLLTQLLDLPFSVDRPLHMEGYLNANSLYSTLQMRSDSVTIGGMGLRDVRLSANSEADNGSILLQAQKKMSGSALMLQLKANAKNDKIRSALSWQETKTKIFNGELAAEATLARNSEKNLLTHIEFLPTMMSINDTLWTISGGNVDILGSTIDISSLRVANHENQSLKVEGRYSANPEDCIVATLRDINVKYILDMVNFDSVILDGLATGQAIFRFADNKLNAHANLTLPHLYFNGTDMGAADILGRFDMNEKRVLLDANIGDEHKTETAHGYIDIDDNYLDLQFTALHTPVGFLNFFTEGILNNVEGKASGSFHLYGDLKKLDFGGDVRVEEGALLIPVTGVRYNLDDARVMFTPGRIAFSEGKFNDGQNGTGTIEGYITHEHIENMHFHFSANFYDALVYDEQKQLNSSFYATARGSGHLELSGRPGALQADIDMTPSVGTDFTYVNDIPEEVVNGGYLRFHSKNESEVDKANYMTDSAEQDEDSEEKSDIRLNLNINLTPDAALHVVMDEKTGDVINLFGRGNISAHYYNKGDFSMFGVCTVDHGLYRFSIQDVIRKNFRLMEGGTVTFAGDPMNADLNVQAYYTVNSASLADLNAGTTFSDNKVRVNCLLNITGKANAPQLSFDLDLPNVNSDEQQMVRKLIATEEDMNMQILYLLGVGRFYTYDAASRAANGNTLAATNSVNSFISSTLSGQLNEILSNALRNDNWTFGTNLATGQQGWNDIEVEALLSGRLLNNRLLINGQFGYRDRATHPTANNFIGDFDIQYLLTRNGNYRLKAYNETNDRYFTKSALMTQGIGFMFQKDFESYADKRRRLRMKKQIEKKD